MAPPTPSHLQVRTIGDVIIARLVAAELLFDDAIIQQVGEELDALVNGREAPKLLLDFGDVRYVASSMLARLVGLQRRMSQAHGHLRLCGLGPILQDTFRVGHFDRVFEIDDDERSALARF